jgi:MFS family permease
VSGSENHRCMAAPTRALTQALASYRTILANRELRRVQLAYATWMTAEWAAIVALAVFAYEQRGALGVGIVGIVRMVPAAVATPFAALIGDRFRRERVLLALQLGSAAALAISAVVFFAGRLEVLVYGLAAILAILSTLSRPILSSLIPSLARTPDELVAANGVSLTTESLGTLAGPVLAGILLAAADAGTVFDAAAGAYLVAVVLLAGLSVEGRVFAAKPIEAGRMADELLAGLRLVASRSQPRLILALFAAQAAVRGALNVLIVVTVFRLLHEGEAWVGFLTAALGAGGLVGAFGSVTLVGRGLARPFGVGLVLWGLPIALLAVWPHEVSALVLLAIVGIGNSLEDVAGFSLLQRLVPDDMLARVLGAGWGAIMGAVGIGSILAPPLGGGLGPRGALIAIGLFLPCLTVLAWRRLLAIDAVARGAVDELAILNEVPMFAPLSVAAKEHVAASLTRLEAGPGTNIIREGEVGDRFYLLVDGEVEITQGGRSFGTRGRGAYFGEIALLRDVPRTATVIARTDVELYVLGRDDFLAAVTGHRAALAAGHAVVDERAGRAAGLASVRGQEGV